MEKEKKEIWMEKLIELLNEYREKELWYRVPEWEEKWQPWIITEQLISKKFWFIKWLVENEKRDIESYCRITSIERKWEKDVYRDEVDSLLMLLSIQDEPINFLISILK